jgi:hypothetical protein
MAITMLSTTIDIAPKIAPAQATSFVVTVIGYLLFIE